MFCDSNTLTKPFSFYANDVDLVTPEMVMDLLSYGSHVYVIVCVSTIPSAQYSPGRLLVYLDGHRTPKDWQILAMTAMAIQKILQKVSRSVFPTLERFVEF